MKRFLGVVELAIGSILLVGVQSTDAIALTPTELDRLARSSTVRIDQGESWGSGVIIKHEGSAYTVLTANHVVLNPGPYTILTVDGQRYPLQYSTVKKLPGVDLAVLQFISNQRYRAVPLGDSTRIPTGANCYVAGFPKTSAQMTVAQAAYQFESGQVEANATHPLADGYGMYYTNDTRAGMSGGPVFNDKGELIAIHGRSLSQFISTRGIDPKSGQKIAFNFGVPVNTFLTLVPKVDPKLGFRAAKPFEQRQTAEDYYVLGLEQYGRGYYQKARAYFTQAIALNPSFAPAYQKRGLLPSISPEVESIFFADVDLSQSTMTEMVKKYAQSKGIQLDFGGGTIPEIQAAMRRLEVEVANEKTNDIASLQRSLQDFNQAIRLTPNDARNYLYRGQILISLQNREASQTDFNQAIRLDSTLTEPYLWRAALRTKIDPQGALTDIEQALRLNPKLMQAYVQRGLVRIIVGDCQGAIADLQTTVDFFQSENDLVSAQAFGMLLEKLRALP
jgi:tetratricopeptide (TPR) repeat protein